MKRLYLLLAAALLLSGCEKQIDMDIEAQDAKVVVNARGEAGQPLKVRLTYSRPVFGTFYVPNGESYFKEVTDATVRLKAGGATYVAGRVEGGYSFVYSPQAGEELELSIDVPGHSTLKSSATVPQTPQVSNVEWRAESNIWSSELSFFLDDNASTADYYAIRLLTHDTIYYTQYLTDSMYRMTDSVTARDTIISDSYAHFRCVDYTVVSGLSIDIIDSEDPDAANTYYGDELRFTDANINGQRHKFTIEPQGYGGDYWDQENHLDDETHRWTSERKNSMELEISSIPRDLYLYRSTVEAYDDSELMSLVGEPVQIHSNVEGGIGIFAISTRLLIPLTSE